MRTKQQELLATATALSERMEQIIVFFAERRVAQQREAAAAGHLRMLREFQTVLGVSSNATTAEIGAAAARRMESSRQDMGFVLAYAFAGLVLIAHAEAGRAAS